MPDFRAIADRLATPKSAYSGYGGSYGYAAGGPFGRSRTLPLHPGSRKDWERQAADVDRCSVVAICLGWLQDNFSTARFEAGEWADAKTFVPDPDHELVQLLGPEGRPNDDYDSDVFFSAALLSWKVDGNVFAIKGRGSGGFGDVKALWWEPHFNVTPWHQPGDPRQVSWYYVARPEGLYRVPVGDMVHIRDGIDKFNPLLGCSRVKSTIMSICGANSAESYSATIVDTMGGLGAVWSPDGEPVDESEALGIASMVRRQTTGENSGRFLALTHAGRFDRIALSPQEMALDSIPDRFEATIAAALGVNPMVPGLAVGATMRSYANQSEAERQSFTNGLVPTWNRFARGIQSQLAVDFAVRRAVRFDRSSVAALAANADAEATRAGGLYLAGLARRNEGRGIAGLPADEREGGDDYAPGHGPAVAGAGDGGGSSTKDPADD